MKKSELINHNGLLQERIGELLRQQRRFEAVLESARLVVECSEVWRDERIGALRRDLRAYNEGQEQ